MRITREMFTEGIVLTGKAVTPMRYQTAEERDANKEKERVRVDDDPKTGTKGTGDYAVDLLGIIDSESFGDEADMTVAVRVPEASVRDIDVKTLRFKTVRFKSLSVDVIPNRKTGGLRVSLTASGLDLPKGAAPRGDA